MEAGNGSGEAHSTLRELSYLYITRYDPVSRMFGNHHIKYHEILQEIIDIIMSKMGFGQNVKFEINVFVSWLHGTSRMNQDLNYNLKFSLAQYFT